MSFKAKLYTKSQIDAIVKNKNVAKFFNTYIEYTPEFKVRAVTQYLEKGMTTKEIFTKAGFDLMVFNQIKRKYLLYGWTRKYKAQGVDGLLHNGRGKIKVNRSTKPRLRINGAMTDKEKIQRLTLEIEYLKKENSFLARLRAMQAE